MVVDSQALLLRAGWLVERSGRAFRGGGALFLGPRVVELLADARAVDAAQRRHGLQARDLSGCVLAPAFVNAHAHLELGALRERLRPGGDFSAWIRALLVERGHVSAPAWHRGLQQAALELLRSGTSLVADIDSLGLPDPRLPLRRQRYVELLDAQDPTRSAAAIERARGQPRLAPHAPYTLCEASLAAIGALARAQQARVSIHWAETDEEELCLEAQQGPMAALLACGPGGRGLERLERAGLLGPLTLLVHGNAASLAERARVARSGAGLVHCPGTHRWFDRPPFDWSGWAHSGVRLALGTDSLASNRAASMRQELAWLLEDQPGLDPWAAHAAATHVAADLLGERGQAGCLTPGARADAIALAGVPADLAELGRMLCEPAHTLVDLWIEGNSCKEFL